MQKKNKNKIYRNFKKWKWKKHEKKKKNLNINATKNAKNACIWRNFIWRRCKEIKNISPEILPRQRLR